MTGTELIIALLELDIPLDRRVRIVGTDDFWAHDVKDIHHDVEQDVIEIQLGRS